MNDDVTNAIYELQLQICATEKQLAKKGDMSAGQIFLIGGRICNLAGKHILELPEEEMIALAEHIPNLIAICSLDPVAITMLAQDIAHKLEDINNDPND